MFNRGARGCCPGVTPQGAQQGLSGDDMYDSSSLTRTDSRRPFPPNPQYTPPTPQQPFPQRRVPRDPGGQQPARHFPAQQRRVPRDPRQQAFPHHAPQQQQPPGPPLPNYRFYRVYDNQGVHSWNLYVPPGEIPRPPLPPHVTVGFYIRLVNVVGNLIGYQLCVPPNLPTPPRGDHWTLISGRGGVLVGYRMVLPQQQTRVAQVPYQVHSPARGSFLPQFTPQFHPQGGLPGQGAADLMATTGPHRGATPMMRGRGHFRPPPMMPGPQRRPPPALAPAPPPLPLPGTHQGAAPRERSPKPFLGESCDSSHFANMSNLFVDEEGLLRTRKMDPQVTKQDAQATVGQPEPAKVPSVHDSEVVEEGSSAAVGGHVEESQSSQLPKEATPKKKPESNRRRSKSRQLKADFDPRLVDWD